ncbi:hypothetical protein BD779DRAFT_1543443 [Infundibulicybe gibba]|nr:hypothetical protein BD779DRAFT_1543443 [Infundibulicybe gibba]
MLSVTPRCEPGHFRSSSMKSKLGLRPRVPLTDKLSVNGARIRAVQRKRIELAVGPVPTEYTQDRLLDLSSDLLQGLSGISPAAPPAGAKPCATAHAYVRTADLLACPLPPTHLLAVRTQGSKRAIAYPTHLPVLAAHCAALPTLPSSRAAPNPDTSVHALPLVHITLPAPHLFPRLLAYLYTKHPRALFPVLPPPAADVFGLAQNAAALGVHDAYLHEMLQQAWARRV